MTDAPTTPRSPVITEEFGACDRCSTTVRRSEMQIHLAHAHNVGPVRPKDKDKDKKKRRNEGR